MHNDYAVSVARMLRLNLYVSERERGVRCMQRLRDSNCCLISQTEGEKERDDRRGRGVVVLNGSQTNVQNSGIAARRPREDGAERKRSASTRCTRLYKRKVGRMGGRELYQLTRRICVCRISLL